MSRTIIDDKIENLLMSPSLGFIVVSVNGSTDVVVSKVFVVVGILVVGLMVGVSMVQLLLSGVVMLESIVC